MPGHASEPVRGHSAVAFGLCIVLATASVTLAESAEGDGCGEWSTVIAEVVDSGFPTTFLDSLRTTLGVTEPVGLRQTPGISAPRKEQFVLEAEWGPFKAGFCVIDCLPDSAGRVINLAARAATNPFVSAFFRLRDYVRSTIDARGLYPLFFQEHVQEGKYRAHRWTLFDPRCGRAFTSKKGADTVSCRSFSQDFMSALYFVRQQRLVPGDSVVTSIVADGKCWTVPFVCGKRATIKVKAGTFNCISVKPRFSTESRAFSKRDEIIVWLSDDDRHIPVLLRSKIKVGSIVGELIEYK
jgi:hypothetical protein